MTATRQITQDEIDEAVLAGRITPDIREAQARKKFDDYVSINKIIETWSAAFSDTIHADKADNAIRSAVIESYELGKAETAAERDKLREQLEEARKTSQRQYEAWKEMEQQAMRANTKVQTLLELDRALIAELSNGQNVPSVAILDMIRAAITKAEGAI